MKNIVLLSFFILSLSTVLISQDLPKYMTEEEKILWKTYKPEVFPEFAVPPPVVVRALAEWEELQGVMITWTSFQAILRQVVQYAQTEGLVYIVCSDSNSVKNYLQSNGVPLVNLRFLIFPFNSIWVRDYGPWAVYAENTDSLFIIDMIYNRPRPLDNQVPFRFANYLNVPVYQATTPPYDLVHSGGNLMFDGLGTAFSSKLILDENPAKNETQIDSIMNMFFGVERYIKMETLPYDVIHHIDMHMKLLDEETLLVGQYPPGVADGPQIEANLQYVLNNFLTPYGKPYRVVRIPMPPHNGNYPPVGNYRTYTNSVIVNKTVIIPTYEEQYDTTAFRIYREAMPGYRIVGINSNSIIPSLGAIHCIVKEIGAFDPVFISHSRMDEIVLSAGPYEIKSIIQTSSGVERANVFWTTDTTAGYNSVQMTQLSGDTMAAYIPSQPNGTEIFYYISASSVSGKTMTKPMPAPAGYYKFTVDAPVFAEGEVSNYNYSLEQNYPNPFNPRTIIGYQLPVTGKVSLKVFDMLGREVAILVDDIKSQGKHEVVFDASRLSSGVYYYTLSSGDFNSTKKLLLVK